MLTQIQNLLRHFFSIVIMLFPLINRFFDERILAATESH